MHTLSFLLAVMISTIATAAIAQQYRNFESQPDAAGGFYGTYGNENFELRPGSGLTGHIGGRRPNVIDERPSRRSGNVGATQRNCVVDGQGKAMCR